MIIAANLSNLFIAVHILMVFIEYFCQVPEIRFYKKVQCYSGGGPSGYSTIGESPRAKLLDNMQL